MIAFWPHCMRDGEGLWHSEEIVKDIKLDFSMSVFVLFFFFVFLLSSSSSLAVFVLVCCNVNLQELMLCFAHSVTTSHWTIDKVKSMMNAFSDINS